MFQDLPKGSHEMSGHCAGWQCTVDKFSMLLISKMLVSHETVTGIKRLMPKSTCTGIFIKGLRRGGVIYEIHIMVHGYFTLLT